MKQLPYLPLPRDNESPRGLILRATRFNGFMRVSQLAIRLNADNNISLIQSLLGKSELAQSLATHMTQHADKFANHFYLQSKGPTIAGNISISNASINYKFFRKSQHHICLDCWNENTFIDRLTDLSLINVCHKHKRYLSHTCPKCNAPLKWGHTLCMKCDSTLESPVKQEYVDDCSGVIAVNEAISHGDSEFFAHLYSLLSALRFDDLEDKKWRNDTLNLAVYLRTATETGLAEFLLDRQKTTPCLPIRVIAAPFLTIKQDEIKNKFVSALDLLDSSYPSSKDCLCGDQYLTLSETVTCLELSSLTTQKLISQNYLQSVSNSKKLIPYKSLCDYFRLFSTNYTNETPDIELEPISFTAPGNSFFEKLADVTAAKLPVYGLDQRKGMDGVLLERMQRVAHFKDSYSEYLSVNQAAKYLNVYSDAIRDLVRSGFMKPSLYYAKQPLFEPEYLRSFDEQYVFGYTLVKQFNIKLRILPALESYGIYPVCSPQKDGAMTSLFSRQDLENKKPNFLQIDYRKDRYKHNLEKKLQTDAHFDNPENYVTAKDVAEALMIRIESITKLIEFGLLIRADVKIKNDNRRFFTKASFEDTKDWFCNAVDLKTLAEEYKINHAQFVKRFVSTKFIKPLRLASGKSLISQRDCINVRNHLSTYCTYSEADKYHNAPEKHFNNLVKTGRFPTVDDSEYFTSKDIRLLRWDDVKAYKF